MKNIAEFTLIGRIGKVEVLNTATRLSIASNYRRRGEDGSYADDTHWNTVVVFAGSTRRYIGEHVARGDLVMARGRLRQSSWDKDGETRYGVDLIRLDFAPGSPPGSRKPAKSSGKPIPSHWRGPTRVRASAYRMGDRRRDQGRR
jgi:single-strand DNA-binding protein